jgi:hypothetical protein
MNNQEKINKLQINKKNIKKKILNKNNDKNKKIESKKIENKNEFNKIIKIEDEPDKKIIIIKPKNGLGNRLRFMFSFIKELKDNNKFNNTKLVVCWLKDKECPYFYLDSLTQIPNVTFINTDNIKDRKIDFSSGGWVEGYQYKNIINNILFSPKLAILEEIKNIIKKLNNNYISVHIRRTDHVGLAKIRNSYTDDNHFINFLKKYKNYNIFLATDCFNTQKKFKEMFKKRIKYINWINNNNPCKRKTLFKDTIIDLFTCAFSKKFMPSGYSSYSYFINLIRKDNNLSSDIIFSPLDIVNNYINKLK